MRFLRPGLAVVAVALVVACQPVGERLPGGTARPLSHEAYVWQRVWGGATVHAVAEAPAVLGGLRVLALELGRDGDVATPVVDAAALARRGLPVTAVVRIDGRHRLGDFSVDEVAAQVARWRQAGANVVGVEVDYDCPTAWLAEYARWLREHRPPAPLRWSVTALPTWAGAGALSQLVAAVDEVVLQLHAVKEPHIFRERDAGRWLARFAASVPWASLRVALPTYRVALGGRELAVRPVELSRFVRSLERVRWPRLRGVVWFRLGVGDGAAWSGETLSAVIRDTPLQPGVRARLKARGQGRFDVVVANRGTVAGRFPRLAFVGAEAVDLVGGYRRDRAHRFAPPSREIPAGAEEIIGWVRGDEVTIEQSR